MIMDINKNWIKVYIIDVLPCISISIYILALLYNISFYSVFNINVLSFVSFTNLLLTIVEPLLFLSFTIFILLSLVFYANTLYITDRKRFDLFQATINPYFYFCIGLKVSFKFLYKLLVKVKFIEPIIRKLKQMIKCFLGNSMVGWIKKRLFKTSSKPNNRNYKDLENFLFFVFFMIISYYVCKYLMLDLKIEGMSKEVLTLVFPIIGYFVQCTFFQSQIQPVEEIKSSIVMFILPYYIFATVVFYLGGIDCANYYLNNNNVKFEIITNNNICFNDSSYIYIEHLNDNYFLFEKKTSDVVVLNNNGIIYSKLKIPNNERASLFMSLFSK